MQTEWLRPLLPLVYPIGFLWLVFLLAVITALVKKRVRAAGYIFAAVLVMWLFGATPFPAWMVESLEAPYARFSMERLPRADAVVMLGGTHDFSQQDPLKMDLSDAADRILVAVDLVRANKAPRLVFGGGSFPSGDYYVPESSLLENWLLEWGVSPNKILSLGICRNTHEEAVRTLELMKSQGWDRVILVTSAFHMPRAAATFQSTGVDIIPVPCDFRVSGRSPQVSGARFRVIPELQGYEQIGTYLHEQIGWWVYRWRGWIKPDESEKTEEVRI